MIEGFFCSWHGEDPHVSQLGHVHSNTRGCAETLRTVRTGCCAGQPCEASLAARARGQVNPAATKTDRRVIQWKLLRWWINVQIPQTVSRVRAIVSLQNTERAKCRKKVWEFRYYLPCFKEYPSVNYIVMLVFLTVKLTQAEGIMKSE